MALKSANIFLVGMMGAGKSSIGRQIAHALQLKFVDSDRVIERRAGGISVAEIFAREGESGFRRREQLAIADITRSAKGIVLATGGGAVLDLANRAYLRERGYVVYLRATLEVLVARTARDGNRPLLQVSDPVDRLRRLLETRDPIYCEVSDLCLDTSFNQAREVVLKLLEHLQVSGACQF